MHTVLNFGSFKQLLSQVHILLQLPLAVAVTTATSETASSSLRRQKTYLCTTMSQDH